MLFGLDGVEVGLIIVFLCLFGGILSGFPVAFAIGGAGIISFGIIASLDSAGILIHHAIDTSSQVYRDLINTGVKPDTVSVFRYPELPTIAQPVFDRGWEVALDRNISFIVNRMNERVLAGASIETLLAVLMFVLMGITLERSKIADDLLTTMARVFGPLPGGLAVSIVVVGAFLAASTGIVGATVVTMGLLALPTMLRNNYSPELATGVIAASGTLGQIIPPSIVIVLLGTLAGDLYSTAQEARAQTAGCSDALTYLGEPAVVSVGTLFQAALLPGIMLALLYALYAFGYAVLNPHKAPAVAMGSSTGEPITRTEGLTWFLGVPAAIIAGAFLLGSVNVIGSQNITVSSFSDSGESASLRTTVGAECQAAMIDLHGQEAWDQAVAEQAEIDAAGGAALSQRLSEEEIATAREAKIAGAASIGTGIAVIAVILGLTLAVGRGVAPSKDAKPLMLGAIGLLLMLLVDVLAIAPTTSSGATVLWIALPLMLGLYGTAEAAARCAKNDLIRVVFPPLVLIVAVLGLDPGRYHQPDARRGAGGGRCDHAGGLPQAAGSGQVGKDRAELHLCRGDLYSGRHQLRPAGEPGRCERRKLDRFLCGLRRLSLCAVRPAVQLLGAVQIRRAVPGGARNRQGDLDGLHHPDRLAAAEPGGDLLWRRTLYPAVPEELRQRADGLPDRDAGAVLPGLRAGLPGDHLHRDPHRGAGDLRRVF